MADNFDFLVQTSSDLDGVLVAYTRDEDGDRNKVLSVAEANEIRVHWELTGTLIDANSLTGSWQVQAHFEGIGTAAEFEIPAAAPQVEPWQASGIYTVNIPLAAPEIQTGTYKVVVTVSHLNADGLPTRMAGFAEIPMVRFI